MFEREAEYWLRKYRAHLCYDHWAPHEFIGRRNGFDIFHRINDAPRSARSENELASAAKAIQDYGYKIVVSHANTDHPKVSMRPL